MSRHITRSLAFFFLSYAFAAGQNKLASDNSAKTTTDTQPAAAQPKLDVVELEKRPRISEGTRMLLIQSINAEFGRTRKNLPLGSKDITVTTDGAVKPGDQRLYQMAITQGAAARVGDRIQITNIAIHDKSVYLEINGGPQKKGKWYQHITISGMGGGVTPGGPEQGGPTGVAVTLEFKNHVPEITGPELKQLLDPIFDFSVKTAQEVYLETVPPKVKAAIKSHEVLVGMNHDMVVMSKDRPPQKTREKDEKGVEYEEWIYGKPPQDVTFVRFVGDEVTEVKIMKVSGEQIVKTEKEVDVRDGVVSLAAATAQGISAASGENQAPQQSGPKPTLKRPGEGNDPMSGQPPVPPPSQPRLGDPTNPSGIPQGQPLPPVQPPTAGQPPPV